MDGVRLTEKGRDWLAMFFCLLCVAGVIGAGLLGNFLLGF